MYVISRAFVSFSPPMYQTEIITLIPKQQITSESWKSPRSKEVSRILLQIINL